MRRPNSFVPRRNDMATSVACAALFTGPDIEGSIAYHHKGLRGANPRRHVFLTFKRSEPLRPFVPKCAVCGASPTVGYLQWFQGRKKVGTFPVCVNDALWTWGYDTFAQTWIRGQLASLLRPMVKKGSIPRVKFSLKP